MLQVTFGFQNSVKVAYVRLFLNFKCVLKMFIKTMISIFGGNNNFSSITLFRKVLYERRMFVLKKFLHHKISSDKSSLRCYVFSMSDSECDSDNEFDL